MNYVQYNKRVCLILNQIQFVPKEIIFNNHLYKNKQLIMYKVLNSIKIKYIVEFKSILINFSLTCFNEPTWSASNVIDVEVFKHNEITLHDSHDYYYEMKIIVEKPNDNFLKFIKFKQGYLK